MTELCPFFDLENPDYVLCAVSYIHIKEDISCKLKTNIQKIQGHITKAHNSDCISTELCPLSDLRNADYLQNPNIKQIKESCHFKTLMMIMQTFIIKADKLFSIFFLLRYANSNLIKTKLKFTYKITT